MADQIRDAATNRWAFAQAEGEIAALMRDADIPDQHPLDGLLEVVRHSGAMMRLLSLLVAQLKETGEVGGECNEAGRWTFWMKGDAALVGVDHEGDGAAHILVALYEKWTTLYMRACKTALDANIDERLVRNAEATSGAFFKAFMIALEAADLTAKQQAAMRTTLAAELRKLNPIEAKVAGM